MYTICNHYIVVEHSLDGTNLGCVAKVNMESNCKFHLNNFLKLKEEKYSLHREPKTNCEAFFLNIFLLCIRTNLSTFLFIKRNIKHSLQCVSYVNPIDNGKLPFLLFGIELLVNNQPNKVEDKFGKC
jgi:hypothetical protein